MLYFFKGYEILRCYFISFICHSIFYVCSILYPFFPSFSIFFNLFISYLFFPYLLTYLIPCPIEKEMMTASHVDTVFSGTTMVLIIMQGEDKKEKLCSIFIITTIIIMILMSIYKCRQYWFHYYILYFDYKIIYNYLFFSHLFF